VDLTQLINETLEQIQQSIESLKESGRRGVAVSKLVDLFAKIAYVAEQDNNERADLHEYNEKLTQLLDAVEQQNYDLFADLLIVEVKPLLEYWISTN
jgi:hypothetical protein